MASSTLAKVIKLFYDMVHRESSLPSVLVEAVDVDHTLNREDKPFKGYLFLVFDDDHYFVKLSLRNRLEIAPVPDLNSHLTYASSSPIALTAPEIYSFSDGCRDWKTAVSNFFRLTNMSAGYICRTYRMVWMATSTMHEVIRRPLRLQ